MMTMSGIFLVVGFVAFAVGAALPPPRAFTGTPDEQRQVVRDHPSRWVGSAVALGTGVVLTFAGLTLLAAVLITEGAWALPILALVSFGLGAALFLVELAFRATVLVSVATANQDVPSWFPPLEAWAGAAYWAYMPLAYLALTAVGAALLQTAVVGSALGWVASGFGLLGAAVYVTRMPRLLWTLFDIPGLLYVITGAIGVALLVAA
jgi:hypothetical protein